MSLNEKQKAYHLRKMRTCAKRFDINKDGYFSREDIELMSERLIECGKLTNEQAEYVRKGFVKYADIFDLKPGEMRPLEEQALKSTKAILSLPAAERKAMIYDPHEKLFDVIDLNKDGHISLEEFKVYFNVMGADVSDEEVVHSFNTIDTDKNGEISRKEFLAAADDFYNGVEETELSKVFLGRLED